MKKQQLTQSIFQFGEQSPKQKNGYASKTKKIQGMDQTTKSSKMFASKIERLKNRPKQQNLEDEYVKGLQDEIHYLQMQLKLLKQKQIAKHSQVDQLQTFFGDGIPINENILAMKNQFNTIKNSAESKLQALQKEVQEREELLEGLKQKNNKLADEFLQKQKKFHQSLDAQNHLSQSLIAEEAKIKKQIDFQEQCLRNIRSDCRKYKEKINSIQRNKQINMVTCLKYDTHKHVKLNKIRESIEEKQKQFAKLEDIYEQMKRQEDDKTYVIEMQEDNLRMKKKIIVMEKQYHALLEKVNQRKIQLEIKLKERQKEINARMDMQARYEKNKEEINRQNGLSAEELEKIAKQRQVKALQKIVEDNRKLSKYVDYYSDLLSKIEENIQLLGVKRPDMKKEIAILQNQLKNMEEQDKKQKQRQYSLHGEIAGSKAKLENYKSVLPDMSEKNQKLSEKLKLSKAERQRLLEDIKPREKQLELIETLKNFNLEEVEVCHNSNMNVQQVLVELMRNWQVISKK